MKSRIWVKGHWRTTNEKASYVLIEKLFCFLAYNRIPGYKFLYNHYIKFWFSAPLDQDDIYDMVEGWFVSRGLDMPWINTEENS